MKKNEKIKPKAIAISHSYADFDAIASTIAVSKLYYDMVPVLNYSCEEEVQRFLSIYKDYLRLIPINNVSFEAVELVVITDFQDISRIKPLVAEMKKRKIMVKIYDHHPTEVHIKGTHRTLKAYGSTTTILYEKLKRQKIPFSVIEATLFLIGIYEDTGSLSFTSTTVKDMEAAAFFLKNGAKLNVISDFVFPPISESQKSLFTQLFAALHILEIKGVQIGICAVESKKYVEGVSFLAHRILESTDVDALFVLVKFKQDLLIVGRSTNEKILHINRIMEYYGGGGHTQAGSAFIKDKNMDLNLLAINVLRKIKKHIRMSRQVKDFMSSPVKVVSSDTSAEETLKIMLRYGHSGLPVVDRDRVVGIISRKDIERMNEEKLRLRPVKFYMSRAPVIISPESSLKEAENLMVDRDIGRLPVISESKLVGILTRSDLLRALYGIHKNQSRRNRKSEDPPDPIEIKLMMEAFISQQRLIVIQNIAKIADQLALSIYIVGGCVRDLFLSLPAKDIDLLVDGNALSIAQQYKKRFPDSRVICNSKFNTAKIIIKEDLAFDLSSARTEYYEHPADLPKVSSGSLREDLYRRDFTINTLAICLNQDRHGLLVNDYHGYEDLKAKKIRVLHNLSFIEDPSRIFRAISYLLKFKFTWESKTKELALNAMKSGIFERTSRYRILNEFISMLKEPISISKALSKLNDIEAIPMLSANIVINKKMLQTIFKAEKLSPYLPEEDRWILYLLLLTLSITNEELEEIMERLKLNKKKKAWLYHFRKHFQASLEFLSGNNLNKASTLVDLLDTYRGEELAALASICNNTQRKAIEWYFFKLRLIQLEATGQEIKDWTKLQGKELGQVLHVLRKMKIDGELSNKKAEKNMAILLSRGVNHEKP
jgi:tRNA nucleotidyltransferase (CCA-adding enzyme)